MNIQEIVQQRLHNQYSSLTNASTAIEVVRWLGAVQSQDYPSAKWAIGLRLPKSHEKEIEQAVAKGSILRTHVLRPTWHFVAPEDIRWMLALTGPRVNAICNTYYKKLGLDEKLFAQSEQVLKKELKGNHRTRLELKTAFKKAGIPIEDMRFLFLIAHAELIGLICSGIPKGKQITYALLEERVPKTKVWTREESLVELVRRYFASHGPATVHDFTWWSGLTIADTKKGLSFIKEIAHEVVEGKEYWFFPIKTKPTPTTAYLLPNYDEYISYRDRSAYFKTKGRLMFAHMIMIDGKIVGAWKKITKKDRIEVETSLFSPLNKLEHKALVEAAQRYSKFLEMPVKIV